MRGSGRENSPMDKSWLVEFVSRDGEELSIPEEFITECSPLLKQSLSKSCISLFENPRKQIETCTLYELKCFKMVVVEYVKTIRRRAPKNGEPQRRPFESVDNLIDNLLGALKLLHKYECKGLVTAAVSTFSREYLPRMALEEYEVDGTDGEIGIRLTKFPLQMYLRQENVDFVIRVQELFGPDMLTPQMKQLLAFGLTRKPRVLACEFAVFLLEGNRVFCNPKMVSALWDPDADDALEFAGKTKSPKMMRPKFSKRPTAKLDVPPRRKSEDLDFASNSPFPIATSMDGSSHGFDVSPPVSIDSSMHGFPAAHQTSGPGHVLLTVPLGLQSMDSSAHGPPPGAQTVFPILSESRESSGHGAHHGGKDFFTVTANGELQESTAHNVGRTFEHPLAPSAAQSMDVSMHGAPPMPMLQSHSQAAALHAKDDLSSPKSIHSIDEDTESADKIVFEAYRITGNTLAALLKEKALGLTYGGFSQDTEWF